jgi:hypothetical protein
MRALKIAFVIVGAVVLLLAGSAAALLAVLNDEDYRQIASYLVERTTGRTVTIEGPFSFHASLDPSLMASDVRVANPPWASRPDLARIGHLEVQLALRPLLSGTLLIPRLILENADFELEKAADGKTNWLTSSARGRLVPVLGTVALRNVGGHYRDQGTGAESSIALGHLTIEDVGNVARLEGEGVWDGRKIGASGEFGTLAQALDPIRPFPIDLSVLLPALELTLHGTIADPIAGQGLDLRLSGHSGNIGELLALLHSDLPLAGHLDGEAQLGGDLAALRLSAVHLSVLNDRSAEPKPNLEMTGQIETIRPGHTVPLEGIDLKVQLATSMAVLSNWRKRELPDLGPVQGRFTLTGNAEALRMADLDLRIGSADQPTIAATGAVDEIRLTPGLAAQGIDLRVEAKTSATAPLAKLLKRPLPELGPVDGRFTVTGNADALKLADLDLRVGSTDQLMMDARGAVGEIRLMPDLAVQGVDLRVEAKALATAPLAKALDRPLPELGPVDGRFAIAGSSQALRLSDLDLRVGSADRLNIAAAGAIDEIHFLPAPAVQGVDVRVEARAPSTAALADAWGRRLPELGALRGSGRLIGGLDRLNLEGVELRAGTPERPVRVTGRIDNVLFLGAARARASFESDLGPLLGWALGRELPALGPVWARAELADIDGRLRIEALDATAGDTEALSARVAGTLGAARDSSWSGLEVELAARDLAMLSPLLDVSLPALGPFAFKGRLEGDLETPRLSGKARLGRTEIEEILHASFAGARPWISGEIATPVLYLADFGIRPNGPWQQDAAAKRAPPRSEARPTSFAALRALDLSLSVQIDQIEGTRLSIDRGSLAISLQDGILRINSDSFDLLEGSAELDAALDTSINPPAITLGATANDLQLGDLLAQLRADVPIEGELDLKAALKTTGSSLPALIPALEGEFGMAIERGRIHLRYFDLTGANVLQWLFTGAALRSSTDLSCFVARFDIKHGVATSQSLFMDTSLARSTGSGTLNLVDQTVDILVHPRPARAELVRLTTPYRIVGPLRDPSVDVSRMGLAGRAVGELVLTPINLLGSLTSLVSDWGQDQNNPCLTWNQRGPADGGRARP